MQCPWCGAAMIAHTIGRTEIDVCERCGARWFDRTELAAAIAAEGPLVTVSWGLPRTREDLTGWPACPRDPGPLLAHEWLGAEFGRCRLCHGVLISEAGWQHLLQAVRLKADPSSLGVGILTVTEAVLETLSWIHH